MHEAQSGLINPKAFIVEGGWVNRAYREGIDKAFNSAWSAPVKKAEHANGKIEAMATSYAVSGFARVNTLETSTGGVLTSPSLECSNFQTVVEGFDFAMSECSLKILSFESFY